MPYTVRQRVNLALETGRRDRYIFVSMTSETLDQLGALPPGSREERLRALPAGAAIDCVGAKRLPVAVVVAVQQAPGVVFARAEGPVRTALLLLRLPCAEPGTAPDAPFTVAVEAPDQVVIRLQARATSHPGLAHHPAHEGLLGLAAGAIRVDLAAIPQVNSVLVAWLLRLSQDHAPLRLDLTSVCRQVCIQLRQLRLDHLLNIVPAADAG
jgi:hypothetical protein